MSLEYACFLSYRRIKSRAYKKIIEEVSEQLNDELSFILGLEKPVYCPDSLWLQGEDSVEERCYVAKALCESACMVLLYMPRYFKNKYCGQEYITMHKLEEERVQLFKSAFEKKLRLIIPLILRGSKNLPDEIRLNPQCFFMDKVSTSEVDHRTIIRLAEYISERYEAFQREFLEKQNFDCGNFAFLSLEDKEARARLDQLDRTKSGKWQFPGFASPQTKSGKWQFPGFAWQ